MLEHVGPVGKISQGHVMDVNKKAFERALKAYDKQLYVRWNPAKLKGHGCWEIRRAADKKTYRYSQPPRRNKIGQLVKDGVQGDIYELDGMIIAFPKYHENDVMNHVLDCAFLNYDALRKIKEMDTWNKEHWIHDIDYLERKTVQEREDKALEELKYDLRYHRTAMRDYMNMVNSGVNPAEVLLASPWVLK